MCVCGRGRKIALKGSGVSSHLYLPIENAVFSTHAFSFPSDKEWRDSVSQRERVQEKGEEMEGKKGQV